MSFDNLCSVLLDWDPAMYRYNRETTDSRPYSIRRDKETGSATIILNAIGVSADDITVDIVRERGIDHLTINGETKNDVLNKSYSVSGRWLIDAENVKDITWSTKDGLLTICVSYKVAEKPKIPITKV